ncbi:hypothetical protein FSP39_023643 [Pinctada imbricata]|uniref:Mitochondria-eating protein C-terminal domain-containing protein n=1 Tax=Pinctada imbricata TaxID=66713 RepID=A0AA88YNU6_PINIB|nr:hypothetical protein FSP39_023643 [Pinctada imbricata]
MAGSGAKNFLNYAECTVKTQDDILPFIPESTGYSLLKFLEATDKSVFNDQFTEESMWNEFARLQIFDQHMILERKARGPDLNRNVVIDKDDFNKMQEEIVKKTEEVEELSTRLSRFASNQLTEGNPNIADLSDAHRPTKVGEMFGQLYDDEWSEAFEALKPPQEGEEEEDEVCVDVLMTLQKIVMKAFEYCSKEVESQMKRLEKDIAVAVEIKIQEKKDETEAKEPSPESAKGDNKEGRPENADQAKDQSTMQEGGGDGKGEKQAEEGMKGQVNQRLKHYVEKQAKEMIKGLASFSSKNAADVFVSEQLPTIIQGEKCNEKRVIAYSKKCIELCWYMSVQDPPMILVALADGDKMNTEQYSYHYRKGKVVELCLWPALFLHTGGPLVAKGHALPKEKGK